MQCHVNETLNKYKNIQNADFILPTFSICKYTEYSAFIQNHYFGKINFYIFVNKAKLFFSFNYFGFLLKNPITEYAICIMAHSWLCRSNLNSKQLYAAQSSSWMIKCLLGKISGCAPRVDIRDGRARNMRPEIYILCKNYIQGALKNKTFLVSQADCAH